MRRQDRGLRRRGIDLFINKITDLFGLRNFFVHGLSNFILNSFRIL